MNDALLEEIEASEALKDRIRYLSGRVMTWLNGLPAGGRLYEELARGDIESIGTCIGLLARVDAEAANEFAGEISTLLAEYNARKMAARKTA